MATSTMETPDYRSQQRELPNKHFPKATHCISIDGPGSQLKSALQVVTEAISSTESVPQQASSSNALSLETNLTSSHTTTTLKLNSLGFSSDTQNDNQSFQVQECPKQFHINHQQTTSHDHSPADPTQGSSNSSLAPNFSSLDSIRTTNGGDIVHPHATIITASGKTITSPDSDVSNGFVKDGKMLPYVFEANEAGKFTHVYF